MSSSRIDPASIPPIPRSPRRRLLVLFLLAAVGALATMLLAEHLEDLARWGEPAIVEDFDDTDWRQRWMVLAGSFKLQEGRLVTTGPEQSVLMLEQRLAAGCAIEFSGISLPGHPVGDLSVIWTEADPASQAQPDPLRYDQSTWLIQTGAYDNSFASISVRPGGRMALSPFRLEPGREHRVRVEIEPESISLLVDGELVCHHRPEVPLSTGHLGIFGYYPGKALDRLAIHHRRMPREVGILAIGNSYFQDGLYPRAADHYRRVAEGSEGELAAEARFRQGLSLLRAGDQEAAFLLWQQLDDPPWTGWIGYHHLAHAADRGDFAAVAAGFAQRYARGQASVRRALERLWVRSLNAMNHTQLAQYLDAWLTLQHEFFPEAVIANEPGAQALVELGRFEQAVTRYERDPWAQRLGLFALGRAEEALRRCPQVQPQARALLAMGDFDALYRDFPQVGWAIRNATWLSGRIGDLPGHGGIDQPAFRGLRVLDDAEGLIDSEHVESRLRALTLLDRCDQVAAEWDTGRNRYAMVPAMLLTGRAQMVIEAPKLGEEFKRRARWQLALEALAAGDTDAAAVRLDDLAQQAWNHTWEDCWFAECFVPVYHALDAGDRDAALAALETVSTETADEFARRAWHVAQYARGEIDAEAVLAQPARIQGEALLALARGLQAELEGRDPSAHYAAYLALPPTRRVTNSGDRDALIEAVIGWRLALRND